MREQRRGLDRRSFLAGTAALLGTEALGQSARPGGDAPAMAATPPDLEFASALDASRAIRRKDVSSVELTRHMLARIEKYNPKVNAVVTLRADEALDSPWRATSPTSSAASGRPRAMSG
jgi:hypothetical protein